MKPMTFTQLATAATLPTLVVLAACSGGNSSSTSETGLFSLSVSDNPVDATSVTIAFRELVLKPTASGAAPISIPVGDADDNPIQIDLLTVTGSQISPLTSSTAVPSGEYQLCIYMLNDESGAANTSFVQTADGVKGLTTNSNGSSCGGTYADRESTGRLFFNKPFTIATGENRFVAEFNLEKALLPPRGNKDYWTLKPTAVQLVNEVAVGHLAGEISLTDLQDCQAVAGALGQSTFNERVYLYTGAIAIDRPLSDGTRLAVDFRDEESEGAVAADEQQPIAAARLEAITDDSDRITGYRYAFGFLSEGNYSIALTCLAQNDNPELNDLATVPATFALYKGSASAAVTANTRSTLNLNP